MVYTRKIQNHSKQKIKMKRITISLIAVCLTVICWNSYAQKKPKLIITPETKTVHQGTNNTSNRPKPKPKPKPKTHPKSNTITELRIVEDTYIYINGHTEQTLECPYYGGVYNYHYSSNSNSQLYYEFRDPQDSYRVNTSDWCNFQNCEGSSFNLKIEPNKSHLYRSTIFRIYDDDNNTAKIVVYQKPCPIGQINNAHLRHNVIIGQDYICNNSRRFIMCVIFAILN